MILVFLSDLHLDRSPYFDSQILVRAFKFAVDLAARHNGALIIPGDLFDKPTVDGYLLDMWAECLRYAREKMVPVHLLEGNHGYDRDGRSIIAHLDTLDLSGVYIYAYQAQAVDFRDISAVFLPYGRGLDEAVDAIPSDKPCLLIGHNDIVGADYGNGAKSVRGFTHEELAATRFCGGIFGHIHTRQELVIGGRSWRYVGAPVQFNFRAAGQLRGVGMLDTSTMTYISHNLIGDDNGQWPHFYTETWRELYSMNGHPTWKFSTLSFARVQATAADPSDEEIRSWCANRGAMKVEIEREVPARQIERRSNIQVDDDPRGIIHRYLQKVQNPRERAELEKVADGILDRIRRTS